MTDLEETQHPSFRLPANKDIPIWRYMDLAKYLAMLDRRSLFFARATLLGDPFEGSSTKMMVVQREYVRKNKATDPALTAYKNTSVGAFNWGHVPKQLVQTYLVSCWHMNEQESAAMWKLYSSSNEAVCIRSTYRRLRLRLPQSIMIGEVKYINYETEGFGPSMATNFIMHKRLSFAHERELRAIFWDLNWVKNAQHHNPAIGPSGLAFELDLPTLIERAYVSPTAAAWFADLVRGMTTKCGFSFPVSHSALAEAPLY